MTETVRIGAAELELIIGDITMTDSDAFVFYAESNLELGSGFGTAISVRGGPTIKKELAELSPVETGEVAVTSAGKLPAKLIIHAVGPKFQEQNTPAKLRTTLLNSLRCAEDKEVKSIAFPPMGAGFYGIPLPLCAQVMVESITEYLRKGSAIEKVLIVALDSREYVPFKQFLETFTEKETVA